MQRQRFRSCIKGQQYYIFFSITMVAICADPELQELTIGADPDQFIGALAVELLLHPVCSKTLRPPLITELK